MNSNLSILFCVRESKIKKKTSELPIYMRITLNGQRLEKSISRAVFKEKWSVSAGKAIGNSEYSRSINAYLDTLRSKVLEHYRKLIEADKPVTIESMRHVLFGETVKPKRLVDVFQKHNDQVKALIGIDFAKATHTRYETTLLHLKHYLESIGKPDYSIKDVDHQFVGDFQFYLKTTKMIGNNTTVKYLKNLNKIIRLALANGDLQKDPFFNHKFKLKEVERQFLTSDELEILAAKDLHVDRVSHVRDVFIFCCYTGLAYSDVKKLSAEHIVKGPDNEDWIYIHRTKTKVKSRIPLLPKAKAILDRYKLYIPLQYKKLLLPVPSNQKMNAYLKEIAHLCGISKPLSTHIARHTFATMSLTNGVPLDTVSKMLGHSSISMSEHYAKITDSKISNDTKHLREDGSVYETAS